LLFFPKLITCFAGIVDPHLIQRIHPWMKKGPLVLGSRFRIFHKYLISVDHFVGVRPARHPTDRCIVVFNR